MIERSRHNGRLFEFIDPEAVDLRNTVVREDESSKARLSALAHVIEDNWSWAWTTTPVDDKDAALRLLQQRVENDF